MLIRWLQLTEVGLYLIYLHIYIYILGVILGPEKQSKFLNVGCSVVSDKQRSSLLTSRQSPTFDSS